MLALVLLACSDYELKGEESPPPFEDSADTADTFADTDTGTPPPPEECNGVDDDGDGDVDEGFEDVDADGLADCVDEQCELALVGAGEVPLSEACAGTVTVSDPWTTRTRSVWAALSTDPQVESIAQTPLVLQMTDDDGDGDVDADDDVDVVFLGWDNGGRSDRGHLLVVDAATGAERADLGGFYYAGEIAAGDLDGDGFPEVVGFDGTNRLQAMSLDGATLWTTAPLTAYIGGQPAVAIVDLEGDGVVEVLAQEAILEGPTGALRASLPDRPFSFTQHVAADLDLDGTAEILYDGDVHDADGTLRWSGLSPGDAYMVHMMALDVDGDPEGEVVMVSDMQLVIYDTDGTELADTSWTGGYASVPCAGDFDGDGAVELAVPAQKNLHVFELDGAELSASPIEDTSTNAGCVGADLDGDGAVELIYADEVALYVIDGRTGTHLVTHSEHGSGTLNETPALADTDDDGAVEIWLGSNDNMGRDTWMGLTRIEHAGAGWTAGPGSWTANARVEGRTDDAGNVVDVGTWWLREDTFRTHPSDGVPLLRDAAVAFDDTCLATCDGDGRVGVAVHVENPGREALPADTLVHLLRVDGDTTTELQRQALGAELPPGTRAASLEFWIAWTDVGSEGLAVVVGEGEADCHPEDNTARRGDVGVCP